MKALLFLLAVTPLTALAAPPQKFCRGINCEPGQSSYDTYKPPPSFFYGKDFHQPTIQHRKRDVVRIVSVAQINPAYTSAYSPDGYDSTTQADILNELRRLGFRLDQVAALAQARGSVVVPPTPGSPGAVVVPVPPQPGTTPPGARPAPGPGGAAIGMAIINAKCAQCHQAGKLAPDQRFTLIDLKGNLAPLTDKQKLRVLTKTYTAQMPPPNNSFGIPSLTDAEEAAIVELMQ